MTTVFLEGDIVSYVGDGLDGIPPAQGKIMAFASETAAHVEWADGPRSRQIDMVSIFDLEKSASQATREAVPTITTHSVRRVMNIEGTEGVLKFLAATGQLDTWERIARETLGYVEGRLKVDASMDLPFEQLSYDEADSVIKQAALTLLRDMFSGEGAA